MSQVSKLFRSHRAQSILLAVAVLVVWEAACRLFDISPLVLPAPGAIAVKL